MGRRPKYARNGAFTRSTASAPSSAERPGLEGWPPTYWCPTCFSVRHSAQDIRDDYCDRCKSFLAELELTYLRAMSAPPKAVPKA